MNNRFFAIYKIHFITILKSKLKKKKKIYTNDHITTIDHIIVRSSKNRCIEGSIKYLITVIKINKKVKRSISDVYEIARHHRE